MTDIDSFRKNAEESCRAFSIEDRRLMTGISENESKSSKILDLYISDIHDKVIFLQRKRKDLNFQKYMIKNLVLSDECSQSKIDEIIYSRISEIKKCFIKNTSLDNDLDNDQQSALHVILSKTEDEIIQIRQKQVSFMLFNEISIKNNVTIYDPFQPICKRFIAKIRIKKERKMGLFSNKKRLEFIKYRLNELALFNNGMIPSIIKNDWELIEVIGLRNSYDKKVSQLPKNQIDNAVKRLEIFDQITVGFKNKQLENNVINSNKINLELTRTKIKEIDTLLLRIFDLSNIQKNQLLSQVKEYRDLFKEQNSIYNKIKN